MREDRLQKGALIAEIVSAIAVVVSLVFVAFQINDNTAAVRAATYDDILSDHIQWRMTVASNPELLAALVKDFNADDLSVEERQAKNFAGQAVWQIFERAYFARKYQTLGDSEWARYERSICTFATSDNFEDELEPYLTTEFAEFAKMCNTSGVR